MESATVLTLPSTGLSCILLIVRTENIPEGPEYEKLSTLFRCTGRSFTNSTSYLKMLSDPSSKLVCGLDDAFP